MRLVFAGTPEVAVPSLEALVGSAHEVVAVVTRPDAPRGRGRTRHPSPVRAAAERLGLPVLTPARPGEPEFLDALRDLEPDACPVVAYGALVPPAALAIPRHGWINLHFSLLPAWRGAAPVQHAIAHGDEITGATTFVLEAGLDTGPVLGTMTETIRPTDTAGALLERLAQAGPGLLVASLDGLADGSIRPVPQPAEGVSPAPKIEVADARIDWGTPAFAIDRWIRACTPAPGAWTIFRGERLKVLAARPVPATADGDAADRSGTPGRLAVGKREVHVRTGAGRLELVTVQPHGKKAMPAADWARGVRIDDGEHLG